MKALIDGEIREMPDGTPFYYKAVINKLESPCRMDLDLAMLTSKINTYKIVEHLVLECMAFDIPDGIMEYLTGPACQFCDGTTWVRWYEGELINES